MKQVNTYGRLEKIVFEIDKYDIIKFLEDAGKIPKGFEAAPEHEQDTDFPILLAVRRVTPETEGQR